MSSTEASSVRSIAELVGLRVMIAEDDPISVSIVTHFLKPLGIRLTVAGNGQKALQAVLDRCHTPDAFEVVLMDMQMPVMNGFEATEQLRTNGIHIPIIACTAVPLKEDQERCHEAGCNSILTKPVIRQELIATLVDVCSQRSKTQKLVHSPDAESTAQSFESGRFQSEDFAVLVERFRCSLARNLESIEAAELHNDSPRICTIAHRLSGTAGNFGFPEITRTAIACERKLLQGATLKQLQPELARLKALIIHAVDPV